MGERTLPWCDALVYAGGTNVQDHTLLPTYMTAKNFTISANTAVRLHVYLVFVKSIEQELKIQ